MAPTGDYAHPSIDQNRTPPTVPEPSSYPHPHPHPRPYPRPDQLNSLLQSNDSVLNPQRTRTSTSTGTSTSSPSRLVTPTFDQNSTININNMASAINVPYSSASALPSSGKEVDLSSYYGYGYNPTALGYGFGQSSNSSTSLQSGLNGNNTTSVTSDPPYSPLTGNQYMTPDFGLNFQNLLGHTYGNDGNDNNAAIWQATQGMYGKYDFMNANTNTNPTPTSASTQALFKSTEPGLQTIPIDQARLPFNGPTPTRSPSPLFEIDETGMDADLDGDGASSPELNELRQSRRRASDTTPSSSRPPPSTRKRRNASLSINTGQRRLSTSHLDPEEKARRAAAAEGLDKGDKRRMQNKLAQRAFRARSKIVNKTAAGRLEQLEQLTEQQAGRIGNLTELVGRLQKENYALKSAKFQEELMKGGMGMGMGMGMGRQDTA